jgi:hypothetical protein
MKKLNYRYKTTENFITEATKKHGDKYDYSLVNYVNAKTKVKIICPIHGEFEQTPRYHISGMNCQKCSGVYMDTNYFIEKANKKHGDKYDYSLVNYVNAKTKVKIICPIHGEFKQRPKDHLLGKGCQKCSGVYMDTNYFIEKANKIHNFEYLYEKTIFNNSHEKVIITCKKHGDFKQSPNAHLSGSACPKCKESKGEKEISFFLKNKSIKFIRQYKFKDCKNINPLPFDFYLPEFNTCIEFHGEQHYKVVKIFGGNEKFEKTKINDNIKYNFCTKNNINLIIINDIKSIKIMLQFL